MSLSVPAKILTSGRATVRVPLATTVMLPCETEGSPVPTVYWLKNRAVLEENASEWPRIVGCVRLCGSQVAVNVCIVGDV